MNQETVNYIVGGAYLAGSVVCCLKGKWRLVAIGVAASIINEIPVAGMYLHRIITMPLAWAPIFVAFRLAYPWSWWARKFFSDQKCLASNLRYGSPEVREHLITAMDEARAASIAELYKEVSSK